MDIRQMLFFFVFAWTAAFSAVAFNPPEDTARPLRIRIEGPAKITAVDTPVPFTVRVENLSSDSLMDGSLRLTVTDQWRVEPNGVVSFKLEAHGSVSIDGTVTAGPGTYNAIYPLHAYAEAGCGMNGYERKAHAVLLIETQMPNPPRPNVATVPWHPVAIGRDNACLLLRLPCFRTLIQVNGETVETRAVGWHGADGRTRASVEPFVSAARPDNREAIGIHPPWHQGLSGTALVEYPLQLPEGQPILLRFAHAIRDTMPTEPSSDGVTFRVRVAAFDAPDATLGDVVFERHSDAKTWQEAEVNLAAFAGKTVRLQFESHPGPRNDTTCDQSYWAMPTVVAGTPKPDSESALGEPVRLGKILFDDLNAEVEWRPGSRGMLDGELAFTMKDGKQIGFRGFRVRVAGSEIGDYVVVAGDVSQTFGDGLLRVVHRLRKGDAAFDLAGEMQVVGGTGLDVRFRLENAPAPKPWNVVYIEDVAAGSWSGELLRVYAGVGNVLEEPRAFNLHFDGHQLASSAVGFDFTNGVSLVQAVDAPPTRLEVSPGERRFTLHAPFNQTMRFFPARDVWQGARACRALDTRPAAGGVQALAGRFVFDLWGGRYRESAQALHRAFRYGLTDSVVVWHNWQRWGYDYRLPDICPPNPNFGSVEDFQALAKTCRDAGVLFAPHDNYIDLYPDADGFSYKHVAFTRDGEPIRAWFNEGQGAQSYRWRTDAYWPFMEKNVQWLKENIAPTGYFIDVFSSIGPYESWTFDGQFHDRLFTRDTWGRTFAWIREQLGDNAPQISESGHDQLIGYLDGAQCNHLRVDPNPPKGAPWTVWPITCRDAERVPWLDMFVHDRFVLHGAGYESRFAGGLPAITHGIYSDDYMSVEILDGHPAMVPEPFSRDVVRKYWLLHEAGRALALKPMHEVRFDGNDMRRLRVEWQGRGKVWVNRGETPWNVKGRELPQYGFYAALDTVEAAIERRDGVVVEWSRSPDSLYVNARSSLDNRFPISVADARVETVEARTVRVTLRWHAQQPTGESLMLFGHFVDESGSIVFQADMQPPVPTNEWTGEIKTISSGEWPADAQPGDAFELRVGMYRPDIGRLPLRGPNDDQQRVRVGTLRIENQGATWTPLPPQPDPIAERGNPDGKLVRFDDLATNGGCRMVRDGDALVVTPLPGHPAFTMEFDAGKMPFGAPLPVRVIAHAENGTIQSGIALQTDSGTLVLNLPKDVFTCRLEP
ncbi:MAG TPA: DUF5696 domain-containing protein [Candidatus Hydrogenedentes bacterium]|nr:DUF5696 domain-containing protein [Candidatus Hydrogenedentota bacterium]HRT21454.1 DUF5696 domain-containing protein [Candidatus Hydrogenedentota bacterium]HRT63943.1 DUF5696 domain-containing protein [Candidatus Hydrogenedentota bacterium]